VITLEPAFGDALLEVHVRLGLERAEGQVLELRLHLGHAEPVGERRVDVERLLRDRLGLLRREVVERPHVVQAVGQLDHEHAQVARHRDEHLAEVLGLALLARGEGELADLGHAVHELRDLAAELALEVRLGGLRVLEHVVEEPRRDRRDVHLEVDEEARDLERVRQVGLARGALLPLVRLSRERVRALQHVEVRPRLVLRNLLDQCLQLGHDAKTFD
jgi:hypothetical protein